MTGPPSTLDDCAARLHHAGWSTGEVPVIIPDGLVWLVIGTRRHGKTLIRARGGRRPRRGGERSSRPGDRAGDRWSRTAAISGGSGGKMEAILDGVAAEFADLSAV